MQLLDIAELGDNLFLVLLALDFLACDFRAADIIRHFVFMQTIALLLVRHNQPPKRLIIAKDAILVDLLLCAVSL